MTKKVFFTTLEKKYYNPEDDIGFVGKTKILQTLAKTKQKQKWLEEWIQSQRASTLHTPIRKKFPRRPIISLGIDWLWEMDLMNMQMYEKYNEGIKYVLCVIDTFSKRADIAFLKNKDPKSTAEALQKILAEGYTWGNKSPFAGSVPKYTRSDMGGEFEGQFFQKFLKKQGVLHHYFSLNVTKAAVVERFQKTIKTSLYRYFTHHNTYRYLEVLPQLVKAYNHRKHRSIKMPPMSVTLKNQEIVRQNLYGKPTPHHQSLLSVGDTVRISKHKTMFDKGYLPNFTEELFKITAIKDDGDLPLYRLKDSMNDPIEGTFYRQELVPAQAPKIHLVQRILRERKNPKTKKKEFLVRWQGHSSKFDSWIPETDLHGG